VLRRLGCGVLAAALDQVGQGLVGAAGRLVGVGVGAQRPQLAQLRVGFADGLGVFVVVDDQLGAFALRHLLDLRAGELAVEQDDAGAHPRGAEVGDEEPARVAGQDGDAVTALDAHLEQPVGHRVRGLVELPVGEFALFVHARRLVGMPPGVERGQHAELAPLVDLIGHHGVVLRRLDSECTRFEDLAHIVQFGRAALEVLLNFGDGLAGQADEVRHEFHPM
jgi:hypothetical protein